MANAVGGFRGFSGVDEVVSKMFEEWTREFEPVRDLAGVATIESFAVTKITVCSSSVVESTCLVEGDSNKRERFKEEIGVDRLIEVDRQWFLLSFQPDEEIRRVLLEDMRAEAQKATELPREEERKEYQLVELLMREDEDKAKEALFEHLGCVDEVSVMTLIQCTMEKHPQLFDVIMNSESKFAKVFIDGVLEGQVQGIKMNGNRMESLCSTLIELIQDVGKELTIQLDKQRNQLRDRASVVSKVTLQQLKAEVVMESTCQTKTVLGQFSQIDLSRLVQSSS